jgi:quercetin dioxygenase-like cupin family protein
MTRARAKLSAVAAALALGVSASLLSAREETPPPKVEAATVGVQHVMTVPVAGDLEKEIDIKIYTFPPGSAVPWHIHPDAQEFEYELEGTLMIEEEGKAPRALKTGEAYHLAPNVVHRGWNASDTEPATIYVVRIKPKDAPLAELVEPRDGENEPEKAGPKAGAYPGPGSKP